MRPQIGNGLACTRCTRVVTAAATLCLPPVTSDGLLQKAQNRRDFPPVLGALPRSWAGIANELGRGHWAKHFSNFSMSAGREECSMLFRRLSELPSILKKKKEMNTRGLEIALRLRALAVL